MPPLISDDQRRKDSDHLKLLSVFHFVLGGLTLLGMGFLILHYAAMHYVFSHPELWKGQHGEMAPPKAIFEALVWVYFVLGAILAVGCVLNIISGVFLLQRKHRMFSMVVAGLDCLQLPFGTVLGIFTLLVLLRDSVRQTYGT